MGFGTNWTEFLGQPAFVLNLDRRPDGLQRTAAGLRQAGFMDIRRFAAIDGKTADLTADLVAQGISKLRPHSIGKLATRAEQGCLLSHLGALRLARQMGLPQVHIFEDDIAFHSEFARLGLQFLRATPPDAAMIYMGAQLGPDIGAAARRGGLGAIALALGLARRPHRLWGDVGAFPAYCLHAYSLTRTGIAALYDFLTQQAAGGWPVDCMTFDAQLDPLPSHVTRFPLRHCVWDARRFPDAARHRSAANSPRNAGLVFQDADLGSDIAD